MRLLLSNCPSSVYLFIAVINLHFYLINLPPTDAPPLANKNYCLRLPKNQHAEYIIKVPSRDGNLLSPPKITPSSITSSQSYARRRIYFLLFVSIKQEICEFCLHSTASISICKSSTTLGAFCWQQQISRLIFPLQSIWDLS